MRAKDILGNKGVDVITVAPNASLDDAISILANHNIGAVVVSSGESRVEGILSERDVVRVLSGAPAGYRDTPVSEVMTADVFTAGPDATIDELLDMMTNRRIRHVPICEDGKMSGLLSIGDVVKHRIRQAVGEAEALKSYISAG